MLENGKISYLELEQLIFSLKDIIVGSYFKKIYHYNGLWLFKFNHYSFIYEPGVAIWPGIFIEREKSLHSVCIKIRKEIGDQKVLSIDIIEDDRTIVLSFKSHKLVLELYAKGNMILLNETNNIVVLTRVHCECSHNTIYTLKPYKIFTDGYVVPKYRWCSSIKKEIKQIEDTNYDFNNIEEALRCMWENKSQATNRVKDAKKPKKKYTPEDNLNMQIDNLNKKMSKKMLEIEKLENIDYSDKNCKVDYCQVGKLYDNYKNIKNKCEKAHSHLSQHLKDKQPPQNKIISKSKINVITNKWYHKYHWWFTKNNFLVIGGKNNTDNEKIVKTYLKDDDLYFHCEEPGSGSFIMITDKRTPDLVDIDETAEGVMCLSNQWNTSFNYGNVVYVKGSQVSKTPPSGEFITKGSFMLYGKKEIIKVSSYTLGYCLYNKTELMLAPYRIVNRYNTSNLKLVPRNDIKKMKGKHITDSLKKTLNIHISEDLYIFNKPCKIFAKFKNI
jgi:predicted ribosome quality control (RQC) complex YloA/Tae2 family protein